MLEKLRIISLNIDHVSFAESLEKVMRWGLAHRPAYVCFANVHMTIEAHQDAFFRENINQANLVLADPRLRVRRTWIDGVAEDATSP